VVILALKVVATTLPLLSTQSENAREEASLSVKAPMHHCTQRCCVHGNHAVGVNTYELLVQHELHFQPQVAIGQGR